MIHLQLVKDYRYEIVAFLTGTAVMTLEIVGARLIAPEFGTSTYVWTAMIGVILGALALGFAIGGKLADRTNSDHVLGLLLFISAMTVLVMGFVQQPVISFLGSLELDLRLGALLAALVLFCPPSIVVGMVSPHLAKNRIISLDSTGRSIGQLEAAGALGSIAGTFLSGYFLLGLFGSRSIVIGIALLLLITSFIAESRRLRAVRWISFTLMTIGVLIMNTNAPHIVADIDSAYARYQVHAARIYNQPVHTLVMDSEGIQSAALTNGSTQLVLEYAQQFMQIAEKLQPKTTLVVGGGAYTFPLALAKTQPSNIIDVAEIDPALDAISKNYFNYTDSKNLTIHHADGRTFINGTNNRYDLVFMDAFSSLSPPFQLTTTEAVHQLRRIIHHEGAVVVNLVSRYSNGNDPYLRATVATYKQHFEHVALYPVFPRLAEGSQKQNFLLVATNSAAAYDSMAELRAGRPMAVNPNGFVLTDDFAPIERLTY